MVFFVVCIQIHRTYTLSKLELTITQNLIICSNQEANVTNQLYAVIEDDKLSFRLTKYFFSVYSLCETVNKILKFDQYDERKQLLEVTSYVPFSI